MQYLSSVSEESGVTATVPPTCPRFACNRPLDDFSLAISSLRALELRASSFEGINLWCDLELVWELSCPVVWADGISSTVASSPVVLHIPLSHLQTTLRSCTHLRAHWNKMPMKLVLFPLRYLLAIRTSIAGLPAPVWFPGLSGILFRIDALVNFERGCQ